MFPSSDQVADTALLGSLERANLNHWITHVRVRVRVTLRLEVYRQSVRLGAKPLETLKILRGL
jgi:hypothetical protein